MKPHLTVIGLHSITAQKIVTGLAHVETSVNISGFLTGAGHVACSKALVWNVREVTEEDHEVPLATYRNPGRHDHSWLCKTRMYAGCADSLHLASRIASLFVLFACFVRRADELVAANEIQNRL